MTLARAPPCELKVVTIVKCRVRANRAFWNFFDTMPAKRTASTPVYSDHYFGKELAGEKPPSFLALRKLYDVACQLLVQEPWNLLAEDQI